MDLKKYYQEFTEALVHAFNEAELTMLVQFKMNLVLGNIVGAGPWEKRVFEVIGWCDSEGRVDELFEIALEKKLKNPKLKALAAKIKADYKAAQQAIESTVQPLTNKDYANPNADQIRQAFAQFQSNGGLQAIAVAAPHLATGQDVIAWAQRGLVARTRVCSIAGKRLGTGFLIGDDRIITNSHVVTAGDALNDFNVAFDFEGTRARDTLPKYTLQKELARSDPKECDYVIFQLNRVPDGNRGFFQVSTRAFTQHESVSVLGHPGGDALKIANGVIFDVNSFMGRVAYSANTAAGSSGSPVFAEDRKLVALHHHGETGVNNHGIPMSAIVNHLKSINQSALLEVET